MAPLLNSDARLVGQTLRGNREAFGRLADRHLSAAYAVALAFLRNPADAEDVTQEAFVKAYTKLDTLREPAKFLPWLVTIVRRECSATLRVRNREANLDDIDYEESAEPNVTARDRARVLQDAMEGLDDMSREVLTLHYFAGKRVREIAIILNITPSAVKKRLERGRHALGKQLQAVTKTNDDAKSMHRLRVELLSIITIIIPTWRAEAVAPASVGALSSTLALWIGVSGFLVATGTVLLYSGTSDEVIAIPEEDEAVAPIAVVEEEGDVAEPGSPVERPSRRSSAASLEIPDVPWPARSAPSDPEFKPPKEFYEASYKSRDSVLDTSVSFSRQNEHIAAIFAGLAASIEIPIVIDWRVVPVPPEIADRFPSDFRNTSPEHLRMAKQQEVPYITDGYLSAADFQGYTLGQIIASIADTLNLVYVVDEYSIILTSPYYYQKDYEQRDRDPTLVGLRERKLFVEIDLAFGHSHIEDVVRQINEAVRANVVIDYRTVAPNAKNGASPFAEGKFPYLGLSEIILEDVLYIVTTQLGLAYSVSNDYILVSTQAQLDTDKGKWDNLRWQHEDKRSISFLDAPLNERLRGDRDLKFITFDNTSISTVFGALSQIDWRSGASLNSMTREIGAERPVGYLPPYPTHLSVAGYLDIITRPMGLIWELDRGDIRIRQAQFGGTP